MISGNFDDKLSFMKRKINKLYQFTFSNNHPINYQLSIINY